MEESVLSDRSPVGLGTYCNTAKCVGKESDRTQDDRADTHITNSAGDEDGTSERHEAGEHDLATQLKETLNFEHCDGLPNGCILSQEKINGVVYFCPKDECNRDASSDVSKDRGTARDANSLRVSTENIEYVAYQSERQMPDIMRLFQKDLSEPYSIYTYRYFIHNWPKLCFLAMDGNQCVGAIVCKLDVHKKLVKRGYIAMLAVDAKYRKRKIGSTLVLKAIQAMIDDDADEVVLETEITNKPALRLYENLGFVRDKRLFRYYLNGVDALRLKLWLR